MDVVYCFFMITIFAEVNAFYGQKGKKTCFIANKKLYVTLKKRDRRNRYYVMKTHATLS